MSTSLQVAGLLIGTMIAQLAGARTYWWVRAKTGTSSGSEWLSAISAGFVTTLGAAIVYIPLRLHNLLDSSWGASVFLALCVGICQGALYRGGRLRPGPREAKR